MSTQTPPVRVAVPAQQVYGRRGPLIGLAVALIVFGAHHLFITMVGHSYTSLFILAVVLVPALAAVSLVGLLHPPIYYTMTNRGKPLPVVLKILAGLIALAGAVGGVYLGQLLYHFL